MNFAPLRSRVPRPGWTGILSLLLTLLLISCGAARPDQEPYLTAIDALRPADLSEGRSLSIVATTNIVADVVGNIGGPDIELTPLIPPGADPHAFQPAPGDLRALSQADLVVINGLGLEAPMESALMTLSQEGIPITSLSEGLDARLQSEQGHPQDESHGQNTDPHVWLDPLNVVRWAENGQRALGRRDPYHAESYRQRAEAYQASLQALHEWILDRVATLPPERRKLVGDHLALGYFAERYGFELVGAIIPGYSTAAEPSPQELGALQEIIRREGVSAIFVEQSLNPRLAARLAQDVGIRVVPLYIGSLSPPSGPAANYIAMMQYNVEAIVQALAP